MTKISLSPSAATPSVARGAVSLALVALATWAVYTLYNAHALAPLAATSVSRAYYIGVALLVTVALWHAFRTVQSTRAGRLA